MSTFYINCSKIPYIKPQLIELSATSGTHGMRGDPKDMMGTEMGNDMFSPS